MPTEPRTLPPHWIGDWESEPKINRLRKCRAMLYLHGMLTEKENRNVIYRINRKEIRDKNENAADHL